MFEGGTATGADRRSTNGRPTGDRAGDSHGDSPVEGAGRPTVALAVEVAMLRERLTDKDGVIADLRQRLDGAERRLDDALAAQRKAADELKGLQAAVDQQRTMGLLRRLRWALRGR